MSNERQGLYERVKSADARAAFDVIEDRLQSAGFVRNYRLNGHVRAVDFRDNGEYLLSFIPNQGDLLFYIRNPAVARAPHLPAKARNEHPGRVNVDLKGRPRENKRNETKIRIANRAEAEKLLSWLINDLPVGARAR